MASAEMQAVDSDRPAGPPPVPAAAKAKRVSATADTPPSMHAVEPLPGYRIDWASAPTQSIPTADASVLGLEDFIDGVQQLPSSVVTEIPPRPIVVGSKMRELAAAVDPDHVRPRRSAATMPVVVPTEYQSVNTVVQKQKLNLLELAVVAFRFFMSFVDAAIERVRRISLK